MRALVLLLTLYAAPAFADDVAMRTERNLGPEQCLQLPAAEVATRCPGLGGRLLSVGGFRYAIVERYEPKRATAWCDETEGHWRCRRIVVLDRELRGARRRNGAAYITASELLKLIATAPSLKIGDELGALFAGAERRRSCIEQPHVGCATEAARLKVFGPGGAPIIKRRLWLVEDADGPLLQCSDATLSRCDALDGAGWLALVVTLRPSSQSPAGPAPEIDVPDVRADQRKLPPADVQAAADAAETPVGALDSYVKPKTTPRALPSAPSRADAARLAQALDQHGRGCLDVDRSTVELTLTGDGNVLALAVDGVGQGAPHDCLLAAARKLPLPRFASSTWRMTALVRKK